MERRRARRRRDLVAAHDVGRDSGTGREVLGLLAGLRLERQKRSTLVSEYAQNQLLWPGETEGTTNVRSFYLEDPMASLPGHS